MHPHSRTKEDTPLKWKVSTKTYVWGVIIALTLAVVLYFMHQWYVVEPALIASSPERITQITGIAPGSGPESEGTHVWFQLPPKQEDRFERHQSFFIDLNDPRVTLTDGSENFISWAGGVEKWSKYYILEVRLNKEWVQETRRQARLPLLR